MPIYENSTILKSPFSTKVRCALIFRGGADEEGFCPSPFFFVCEYFTSHYFARRFLTPFAILHRKITVAPPAASTTSLNVDIKVQVGEGEPIESALRRFKREVNKSGHLMDLRHKRYFENSQDRKKRKIVQARFRVRMERMNARRMKQQRT